MGLTSHPVASSHTAGSTSEGAAATAQPVAGCHAWTQAHGVCGSLWRGVDSRSRQWCRLPRGRVAQRSPVRRNGETPHQRLHNQVYKVPNAGGERRGKGVTWTPGREWLSARVVFNPWVSKITGRARTAFSWPRITEAHLSLASFEASVCPDRDVSTFRFLTDRLGERGERAT